MLLTDCFDKKFKIIIDCDITDKQMEMLYWLNNNTIGVTVVKFLKAHQISGQWVTTYEGKDRCFVAFENLDDALVFKIRYRI
jgi:hypothetical protein